MPVFTGFLNDFLAAFPTLEPCDLLTAMEYLTSDNDLVSMPYSYRAIAKYLHDMKFVYGLNVAVLPNGRITVNHGDYIPYLSPTGRELLNELQARCKTVEHITAGNESNKIKRSLNRVKPFFKRFWKFFITVPLIVETLIHWKQIVNFITLFIQRFLSE